jgi:anti-sigma B factor antagonist
MADNDKAVTCNMTPVPRRRRQAPANFDHAYRREATLTVTVADRRHRVIVTEVAGEIDLRTSEILRARLLELLDEGFSGIVVNFAEVLFCDASGLGTLVAVHNRLRARGGELRVARARAPQRRLFQITGLDQVISLHDTVEDAVRGLGADGVGTQVTLN